MSCLTNQFYTIQDCWASAIFQTCIAHNINLACVGPGSRSTPLILALSKFKSIQKIIHFDERSLAYFALGAAKLSKRPSIIITTSGTAVANLLPAVIEAYHDNIPLLVITADRPDSSHEIGANQTINQYDIFKSFIHYFHHLPLPSLDISIDNVKDATEKAITTSLLQSGPVHINCPFSKPLITELKTDFSEYLKKQSSKISFGKSSQKKPLVLNKPNYKQFETMCNQSKKPIIIVGKCPCPKDFKKILKFSETHSIPIFADALSHHSFYNHPNINYSMDEFFEDDSFNPDLLIIIGDKLSSISGLKWLESSSVPLIQIHFYHNLYNPHSKEGCFWIDPRLDLLSQADVTIELEEEWTRNVVKKKPFNKETNGVWNKEKDVVATICKNLNDKNILFASNSSSIRLVNNVSDQLGCIEVYSNRGASGIDGIISTAIGCAHETNKDLVLIIGDLSFMYDLTALAFLKSVLKPIKLFVLNNYGGGLFKQLNISKDEDFFNTYFYAKHNYNFSEASKQFGINYSKISDLNQVKNKVSDVMDSKTHEVLEIIF
ncbi:2-succinyl-5-enolpyruvyl-6-hydroxy-3-cyclohexene-1-carboxylic-acid synthase [Candidatus Marinamargulisbacteria bacterium SCGC AAA071-K20]|nr:2-succinyl-5-enolpyruvyl-6-hydroxy-3-cyclohexene-1-carboxylic-acid synthase [Candidatus Marinamargulisbacteria bacterium SCGC AAA071-K20]